MSTPGLLLLLGPSGVGKSSVIDELVHLDSSLVAVAAYTTRPPRSEDNYRLSVSPETFELIANRERLLALNDLYGFRYGTSATAVSVALLSGRSVVADCPIKRVGSFEDAFPNATYRAYLKPPSVNALRLRLADGRDGHGQRLTAALAEISSLERGDFDHLIDISVVNADLASQATARQIYEAWAQHRQRQSHT